jgi:HPr kinase/phosphorylase
VNSLSISELLDRRGRLLELEVVAGEEGLAREVRSADISSPGLVLAGFTERFPSGRLQVLGETEIMYLRSLDPDRRREVLEAFFAFDPPCVFVTKGLEAPDDLVALARQLKVPVVRSSLKTGEFFRRIKAFLEDEFAPSTALHGSLADVYGVGLLFVGASGIGKSE